MKNKYYILFLIILILNSCGENKNPEIEVYENTIKGKRAELVKLSQFIIDENSSAFIGRFMNVKFREGKLIIADIMQPSLFFINPNNGKIVKNLKWKKGEGPGEILIIGEFEIMNGRIYVADMGNFRWSIFDTTGKFIKSEKPFFDSLNEKEEFYAENAKGMESYNNKIYTTIIEVKYNRELQQHKSKSIALLDSSLKIIKVFGFMDEIYGKLRLYQPTAAITIDKNGFIYYSQMPSYRIYKYNSDGNFIKAFGVKGNFKVINEDLTANASFQKIKTISTKYSSAGELFSSPIGYILQQFVDLTDKSFDTRNFLDRIHYLKVYDTEGNYIPSDIKLPGWLMTVDDEGKLYIYENDEPGNRVVGVYELKIVKD